METFRPELAAALRGPRPYLDEVLADRPVAGWLFREASGTVAAPVVSNDTGTYTSTPTLGVVGPLRGVPNTAIALTAAAGNYVAVADSATFDVGDVVSLEVWFKRGSVGGGEGGLFEKGDHFGLRFDGLDKVQFWSTGIDTWCRSSITITDTTTWHHVVAAKSGATRLIYIDGVDVSVPEGTGTLANNATALALGRNPSLSDSLTGSLAFPFIYPTVLSPARVLAHYRAAGY